VVSIPPATPFAQGGPTITIAENFGKMRLTTRRMLLKRMSLKAHSTASLDETEADFGFLFPFFFQYVILLKWSRSMFALDIDCDDVDLLLELEE
jgi:hypothetical protein